ncbi:lipopolysaccharide biosynthesis protein [Pseudomonas sp. NPDC007930]|uniref:lipopolysaccharide biosynthesis protein n=1 Tax=Pseudomonas sp. NPDC007930 TaxID=3364417 RepID=UPI0036E06205
MSFDRCRNIASGAVFILASGPSAGQFPLQRYAGVPMIAVNGAISLFNGSRQKPWCYVCTDMGFMEQQPELYARALAISERVAVWPEAVERFPLPVAGELYAPRKVPEPGWVEQFFEDPELARGYAGQWPRRRRIGFSKNLEKGYFDARTVPYVALQMAYHAGFDTVFLVGFDLNQAAPRFYEKPGAKASPCELDKHYETRILPSLRLMAEQVVGERFRVYNLSPGSRVPPSIIPFAPLQQVDELLGQARGGAAPLRACAVPAQGMAR